MPGRLTRGVDWGPGSPGSPGENLTKLIKMGQNRLKKGKNEQKVLVKFDSPGQFFQPATSLTPYKNVQHF